MKKHSAIVGEVAKLACFPKQDVSRILVALGTIMQKNLLAGEEVALRKIGRFKRGYVAPGKRCAPNGQPLTQVLNAVYFKPAKSLRERMRQYGRQR